MRQLTASRHEDFFAEGFELVSELESYIPEHSMPTTAAIFDSYL